MAIKPPDYEDMMRVAKVIRKFMEEVSSLEVGIDAIISDTVRTVTTNPDYFMNGKAPSMEYIKATYMLSGLPENHLVDLRVELGKKKAELDEAKRAFDILRDAVTIYVTESANQRSSLI
jgi:hypothetical protein